MAGIGFALRRLTSRRDLLGVVEAYGLSTLLSAGPWLFTIVAIVLVTQIGSRVAAWEEIVLFRAVITYNFSFSLVLSAPIVNVATRFLADQIYAKDTSRAMGILFMALVLYFVLATVAGLIFYGVYADITPFQRVGAISGLYLVGFIWVTTIFVSALKDYRTVAFIFGAGMASAVAASFIIGLYFAGEGLIHGFNAGLAVIFFALLARIFAEYPFRIAKPWELLKRFRPYWVLALSGFTYSMAIWIDKWLMWALEPDAEASGGILYTLPFYDSAMFLAYLITVPGMALFFVSIETEFFEYYQRFYGSFQEHATLAQIRHHRDRIAAFVGNSLRNLAIFLACLVVVAVVSASAWFEALGITFRQIGVYRLGTVGAFLHTLFIFESVMLSYFDMRKVVLGLNTLFLASNAIATVITLNLGFPYYGLGYLSAAAISFIAGLLVLVYKLKWLDYNAFVLNNPSIR
ncbi:MAG: exopolysaccharide Pel transporter PelG [Alphaproteobacteria bacterium]